VVVVVVVTAGQPRAAKLIFYIKNDMLLSKKFKLMRQFNK
jgi:hypothetical protein